MVLCFSCVDKNFVYNFLTKFLVNNEGGLDMEEELNNLNYTIEKYNKVIDDKINIHKILKLHYLKKDKNFNVRVKFVIF